MSVFARFYVSHLPMSVRRLSLSPTLTDIKRRKSCYQKPTAPASMADGGSSTEKQNQDRGSIKEVNGDLFTCPQSHSLAHCISADIRMGKGIAVKFKEMFGGVNELLEQHQTSGGLAVLERHGRFIYYLITKEKYWQKPTIDTLTESLKKMRDHNLEKGIKHLCMPTIGCGLDKLKWHDVRCTLDNLYKDTDVEITVYHFADPNVTKQQKPGSGRRRQDHKKDSSWSNPGSSDYSFNTKTPEDHYRDNCHRKAQPHSQKADQDQRSLASQTKRHRANNSGYYRNNAQSRSRYSYKKQNKSTKYVNAQHSNNHRGNGPPHCRDPDLVRSQSAPQKKLHKGNQSDNHGGDGTSDSRNPEQVRRKSLPQTKHLINNH